MRKAELMLPDKDFSVEVQMHWDEAPLTCAAVWDMLAQPLEQRSHHAVFSGYEFFVYCPPVNLPLENHVVYPKPGQLLYYFLPAGRNADNVAHKINLGGHREDAAEIAIWYGEGELRRMTECGVRGNHFATVEDGLTEFFKVGHSILEHGQTRVVLRRSDS